MGVSGAALGISGRENCVDKNKGANDLSTKPWSFGVAMGYRVGPATKHLEGAALLEALHYRRTGDRPKRLHDDVENRPCQRQLPGQKQPERHRRVYVTPCGIKQPLT